MSQIVEESFAALPVDIQISIWDYATYTDLGRLCITCHAINDLIGLGTESKVNRVVWRGVYTRLRRGELDVYSMNILFVAIDFLVFCKILLTVYYVLFN